MIRTRWALAIASMGIACIALQASAQHVPDSAMPGIRIQRDIPYVPNGDPAQRLDLFVPEGPSEKPFPLIIWVHGGGWMAGSKDGGPAMEFMHKGYAVASVEYRFSQKALFPAQIQDCQAAIRWLRANAKQQNIDADHFAVWGASAGGHLVALLGTAGGSDAFPKIGGNEEQSDRVQAVIDLFGPTNFATVKAQADADKGVKYVYNFADQTNPYARLIGAKLGDDAEKEKRVSPVSYITADDPPMLILHGTADPHVPYAQSVEFAESLKKSGVPVLLQKLPGAGHGGPAFGLPGVRTLVVHFLDKHLKGADVEVKLVPEEQAIAPKPTTKPATKPAK